MTHNNTLLSQVSHFITVKKYGLVLSIGEEPNKSFAPPVLDFGNVPTGSALGKSSKAGQQGVENMEAVGGEGSDKVEGNRDHFVPNG